MRFEPPGKPVSARNGKRVEKKKVSQTLFYYARVSCRTMYKFLQRMFTFCTKMTYTKPQTWKTPPKDPKVAQECPRSDFNAPKVTSESPQSGSRCSQNEPKSYQVVPQGCPRPPKIDQKSSPRPSRDTFKKTNVSKLREPHYLLCF